MSTKAPSLSVIASKFMEGRIRRVFFIVLTVLLYGVSAGCYVAETIAPGAIIDSMGLQILCQVAMVLWPLLTLTMFSWYLGKRRFGPIRAFWAIFLSSLGVALLTFSGLVWFTPQSDGGASDVFIEALEVQGVMLVLVAFVGFLWAMLRELVLYKRNRVSTRNWYAMIILVMVAALSTLAQSPVLLWMMTGSAVVMILVNVFRLSWIVYLSFREKLLALLLSVLTLASLTLLLFLVFIDSTALPTAINNLALYFVTLLLIFGILYCTTTVLSLVFHLPTTGVFAEKAGEVEAMHALSRLVGQVFDFEKLVHTIVTSPVDSGMNDSAWLALVDVQSGSLDPRIVASHNLDFATISEAIDTKALCTDAMNRRTPLVLNRANADHRVNLLPGQTVGCLMVLPLIARDEPMGALFVAKEYAEGYEENDIPALRGFADQAALALDNAHLFQERLEKERLTRELTIAREMQQKLLPQILPAIQGLDMAACSVSAQEVGGDYYDIIQVDEHKYGVIVGDVSGKGTSAAFYMAELKGVYQSLSSLTNSPAAFLEYANNALSRSMEKNAFISAVYGVIDLKEESITLARAGHCPVAMVGLDGQVTFLRTGGMGLGLTSSDLFTQSLDEHAISMVPGDVFIFYTDGLTESRSADGEEYGYDRLKAIIGAHRHEDAPDLHDAILSDLNRFIGRNHDYDDDLTLVVLKWAGVNHARPKHEHKTGLIPEAIYTQFI